MTHVNTAHRGARIAAALVAVILGVTACGSDKDSASSNTAPSVNGDAGQVAPAATTAAADSASGETPAGSTATGGFDLPASALPADPPQTKFLAIDVSYGIEVDDINKGINDIV
ncbi:MAG: hypothetical protein QOJ08_2342, partial [Ilumatobacteraceae bacterium]